MSILMLVVVSGAMVSATPMSRPGSFGTAIDDTQLSEIAGTGAGTTRLSVLVQDQGSSQGQFASEDLRTSLSTWFADSIIQSIANEAILRG